MASCNPIPLHSDLIQSEMWPKLITQTFEAMPVISMQIESVLSAHLAVKKVDLSAGISE